MSQRKQARYTTCSKIAASALSAAHVINHQSANQLRVAVSWPPYRRNQRAPEKKARACARAHEKSNWANNTRSLRKISRARCLSLLYRLHSIVRDWWPYGTLYGWHDFAAARGAIIERWLMGEARYFFCVWFVNFLGESVSFFLNWWCDGRDFFHLSYFRECGVFEWAMLIIR